MVHLSISISICICICICSDIHVYVYNLIYFCGGYAANGRVATVGYSCGRYIIIQTQYVYIYLCISIHMSD